MKKMLKRSISIILALSLCLVAMQITTLADTLTKADSQTLSEWIEMADDLLNQGKTYASGKAEFDAAYNSAKSMLESVKPDVCIVTTMSLMNDLKEPLMLCAELGINAITTCEEAFYPANSNPVLTNKLDEIAKRTNCTITGSGYQDIYWGQIISSIARSTQTIKKIKQV